MALNQTLIILMYNFSQFISLRISVAAYHNSVPTLKFCMDNKIMQKLRYYRNITHAQNLDNNLLSLVVFFSDAFYGFLLRFG